jgi:hypothetical protein
MGGYGSGRYGGRPTADASLRIDLAWMLRTRRAQEGCELAGSLHWTCGGSPSGSIGYRAVMNEPGEERLVLNYTRGSGEDAEHVLQSIYLCHTVPNYGGKRWWMICPYRGNRVGKLYLPPGGDRFASRQAWRLGYQCQRDAARDRPFERLFRLQKKLGCDQGWEAGLQRPKGMWNRTFDRHMERYWQLDEECAIEMASMMARLGGWRSAA